MLLIFDVTMITMIWIDSFCFNGIQYCPKDMVLRAHSARKRIKMTFHRNFVRFTDLRGKVMACHRLKRHTGIVPVHAHGYFMIFKACHPHPHVYYLRTFYFYLLANNQTCECTVISPTLI